MITVQFRCGFNQKYRPLGPKRIPTIRQCFRALSFAFFALDSTMTFHAGSYLFFALIGLGGKRDQPSQKHFSASLTPRIELSARNSPFNGFSFFSTINSRTITRF
jgi:hypothetical protein